LKRKELQSSLHQFREGLTVEKEGASIFFASVSGSPLPAWASRTLEMSKLPL